MQKHLQRNGTLSAILSPPRAMAISELFEDSFEIVDDFLGEPEDIKARLI